MGKKEGKTLAEVFSNEKMEKYDLMTENARLRERLRRLEFWLEFIINSSLMNPEIEKSARAVLDEGVL
jgi:hypothetical protein